MGYGPLVAAALVSGLLLLLGALDGVERGLSLVREALGTPGDTLAFGEHPRVDRRLMLLPCVLLALFAGPLLAGHRRRRAWSLAGILAATAFGASILVEATASVTIEISALLLSTLGCIGWGCLSRIDRTTWRRVLTGGRVSPTEVLMHHVVQNSFDAVVTLREDGTIETFNRAAEKMFGWAACDATGRNLNELVRIGRSEGESGWIPIHRLRDSKVPCEAMGHDRDGTSFPLELILSTTVLDGVSRRVAFLRDITWRKAQQELLQHQATHDSLTDLPNRHLLEQRTAHALQEARANDSQVALLLLDLDRFKEINDTLGHHTGDLLLQLTAERLRKVLRPSDTLARLGGDEFAILLAESDEAKAREVTRELSRLLIDPFHVEGLTLKLDATIGIALFPGHGSEPMELIQRADVAMYSAKRARSTVVVYDPELDSSSMRQLTLTSELRSAIENDSLSLVYQPKIDAETSRVVGVEALVRWQHPELGNVRPDEFIGLAENTGLIRPLTGWVLRTALLQCSEWHRNGLDIGVSVNISARNLLEEELPDTLAALLDETGVPPHRVTLEITENVIMENPEGAHEVATELAVMGVAISIDDFGTGYSSLGYLRRLPAAEIKIDRCFVQDMDRNADDATIVRSTIELAHNLGRKVVAEGIERPEIWEALRRHGCDYGQGYYFSRPLPSDDLLRWLAARKGTAEEQQLVVT